MTVGGRHIDPQASVVVNGRLTKATVSLESDETVKLELEQLPPPGTHLLQIQNPDGLFSNDFIFHVAESKRQAQAMQQQITDDRTDQRVALVEAVRRNNIEEIKKLIARKTRLNQRHPEQGSTPLGTAALHGHIDAAQLLIESGARVSHSNRDGNTPLHIAAFLCRFEMVELLLKNGASLTKKSNREETARDTVAGAMSPGLAEFYRGVAAATRIEIDMDSLEEDRQRMADYLRSREEPDTDKDDSGKTQ